MDKPVYLSKRVTENSNITDEGILVYIALRTKYYFQKWHFSRDMIHYEDLLWILMEDDKYTKNYLKKIIFKYLRPLMNILRFVRNSKA